MQTSNKKVSYQQQKAINNQFMALIADLRTPSQAQAFFDAFLTKTEQSVFAKRLGIIWMLHQGKSYEEIKKKLKVSSATISSVASQMDEEKTQFIVNKLRVEHWADKWAQKLTSWLPLR